MRRSFLTFAAALMVLALPAQAESLDGSAIRANLAGAKFVGINKYKSPYTYSFYSNGRLKGILGKKNQFDDRGRWWVRDDKLCMDWELWEMGKPHCYGVDLAGDQISRLKADGRVHQTSTLVAR